MTAPKLTEPVSKQAEYWPWVAMVARCTNPRNISYPKYGAKGIGVAASWRGKLGYVAFREHIGPRPSKAHTIDRIDTKGQYVPGNVRWATNHEQHRNRSDNRTITFNGETLCAADWAAKLGISRESMSRRLREWPVERALTEVKRKRCLTKLTAAQRWRVDGWYKQAANRHASADAACGRSWVCACGPCKVARERNYRPRLTDAGRAALRGKS